MSRTHSLSFRILALVTATVAGITACQDQGPVQPFSNPNGPSAASEQLIPIKGKPQFYFNGIVFTGTHDAVSGELYTMNPDGSNVSRITFDDSTDIDPDVSPTGPSVVYIRRAYMSLISDIYTIGLDGKNRKRLTNLNTSVIWPRYSPDGSKIVFISKVPGASYDIFVMNANGTGITRLTFGLQRGTSPSWSPDGSRIAFQADDANGNSGVWTMNANGTNQSLLVACAYPGCGHPKWSPIANEIAFDHVDFSGISVVDATTGVQTGYISGSVHDYNGTWSKDGSTIIFTSERSQNGGLDLYASAPTRGAVTAPPPAVQLTKFIGNEVTPAYSR